MSVVDEILKMLQGAIAPELKALTAKVDANHQETTIRLEAMNQRFDDLIQRLDLDRRVQNLERALDERPQ